MLIKLSKNIVIEKLTTKVLILNIDTGKYLETDNLGGSILQKINSSIEYKNLLKFFLEKTGIDRDQADSDLKDFLNEAKNAGLVYVDE